MPPSTWEAGRACAVALRVRNFFMNMSTKGKIPALVLIMAVLLSGVGFLGYDSATKADEAMDGMYANSLVPVELIFDSLVQGRAIEANLYSLMLTTDEKENQDPGDGGENQG